MSNPQTADALTIVNSIVAGNSDDGTAPDISLPADFGSNLNIEFSLIGDTTGSLIDASTGTGNILNQPAMLGPLADNGGPTLTHALLLGSPALNAGSNTLAVDANGASLTTDQRGAGFGRIVGASVDIGAFEAQIGDFQTQTSAATAAMKNPTSAPATAARSDASSPALVFDQGIFDQDDSSPKTASNSTVTKADELALAGDHRLRDDVFGSDF